MNSCAEKDPSNLAVLKIVMGQPKDVVAQKANAVLGPVNWVLLLISRVNVDSDLAFCDLWQHFLKCPLQSSMFHGGLVVTYIWASLYSGVPFWRGTGHISIVKALRSAVIKSFLNFFFFFFVFLPFLRPLPRHMEAPRLGVESEL